MNDIDISTLVADRSAEFISRTQEALGCIQTTSAYVDAVKTMSSCKGKIITTGMGKAGHTARKVSSSLSSLGMPSAYIHPGEASHGDIGIVSPQDIMLAFSTSGKTREVLETVSFARNLGIDCVISITSHKDSDIRSLSDIVIDMGEVGEAGYLNIAPTTSIVVMLVIADMLAVISSELKGFKMKDYATRHHGGYLGQKSRGESDDSEDSR